MKKIVILLFLQNIDYYFKINQPNICFDNKMEIRCALNGFVVRSTFPKAGDFWKVNDKVGIKACTKPHKGPIGGLDF